LAGAIHVVPEIVDCIAECGLRDRLIIARVEDVELLELLFDRFERLLSLAGGALHPAPALFA
jgi:hypothetical protein